MRWRIGCLLLAACGTSAAKEGVIARPPEANGSQPPLAEKGGAAVGREETTAEPWAMRAGRIGRLRYVRGELFAVFGADDPRFVGRLEIEDNYADNWVETTAVPASAQPPAHVLVVPLEPERPAVELELRTAVEIHDVYVDHIIGQPNRDELAARGFRVMQCGGAEPDWKVCNEGDLVVVGPTTKVPLPAEPSAAAPASVRSIYVNARGARTEGVRSVVLAAQLGLHWATEEGERTRGNLVWTAAPSERDAFTSNVWPRSLLIAGDSFLVFSLDDPIRHDARRRIRLHQFRAGYAPIEYRVHVSD